MVENKFKVVINNRNRLSTTKKMVEDLLSRNTQGIIIIDNASTYPPLLEWYNTLPSEVDIRMFKNEGHLALFSTGLIHEIKEDWCIYTDSDIQLNPNMPVNYQEQMLDVANTLNCHKIGVALSINDIPDHYWLKAQVLRNEDRWWHEETLPTIYKAHTDTTFCFIKKVDQFDSYRMAGDFTAKHMPWYIDMDNLDDEERYFIHHSSLDKVTQYTKQHKLGQEL